MSALRLKSYEFRREREKGWQELEGLVARAERRGVGSLGEADRLRLPMLYRGALSALSVARAISLDRALLEYLEALCQRAYFVVYGPRQPLNLVVADFFARRLPATFRRHLFPLLVAGVLLAAATLAGYVLVEAEPDRYYAFVPETMAAGRDPTATTAFLREGLYRRGDAGDALATFSAFLFTHNARVGMLSFALGFVAGVPVVLMLMITGLMLGAMTWLHASRGLAMDWWGWILPHGVTELLALVMCAGAGFAIARALLFPGMRRRVDALAAAGREAGVLVAGAVVLFFVAGLLEGFFRQLVLDPTVRYTVVVLTTGFWIAYFGFVGRARPPA